MGMGTNLTSNIKSWTSLAMVIVVASIVLVKFKSVSGSTTETNSTVDLFVTGFQEPANWIGILVIALLGGYLIKHFGKKN